MKSSTPLFLILDGNALLHRAWHAIPPLTTQDGTVVNAVYGFTTILEKLLEQYDPAYMAVAWDLPGGTFRHEADETYKAHRTEKEPELYDQVPMIQDLLELYGIPSLSEPGFEADDLLGAISHKFASKDLHCMIVTGDHDTMQLVTDDISVLTFVKGVSKTKTYTPDAVKERFQVTPAQMVDYKVLVGDSSDNIKGFPGIGPKTAVAILEEYGDLDVVLKTAKDGLLPAKWQKRFEGEEIERLVSDLRHLVTIRTDIDTPDDLDFYKVHVDESALYDALLSYEFKTLAARYVEAARSEGSVTTTKDSLLQETSSASELSGDSAFLVLHEESLYLFDTSSYVALSEKEVAFLFEGSLVSGTIIVHDLKGLLHAQGVDPAGVTFSFRDLFLEAYVVDENVRDYSLAGLYEFFLQKQLGEGLEDTHGAMKALAEYFDSEIKEEDLQHIHALEHQVLPVLYHMESLGIQVDLDALSSLSELTANEIAKLEAVIYKDAGEEFNINSPSQLAGILFDVLELPTKGIKKTKTGYSTRASELEKLWDAHPIIEKVSQYRELAKLKSTYIDALPTYVDEKDHIHTTYNQNGTVTGRLSSTEPNLQNIPIRTELGNKVRSAFVSAEGYSLVAIDYSQIELRLVAEISEDEAFIQSFLDGKDIHTATAARVFDISDDAVDSDMRRKAKAINFGILYGMGSRSLARATDTTQKEAKAFIEKYFELHTGIAKYLEETKAQVHEKGFVQTLWGRRRRLPEIDSGIQMLVASAERQAINAPIQGTKADIVKQAMIDVESWIRSQDKDVRMLLQVHDELVFEISTQDLDEVVPRLSELMQNVWSGRVPLLVNAKVGVNWGEMTDL